MRSISGTTLWTFYRTARNPAVSSQTCVSGGSVIPSLENGAAVRSHRERPEGASGPRNPRRSGEAATEGGDAGFWSSFCKGASEASDRGKRSLFDVVDVFEAVLSGGLGVLGAVVDRLGDALGLLDGHVAAVDDVHQRGDGPQGVDVEQRRSKRTH